MSTENLHETIRKQIEFYFGDANLSRDSFLKEKIAENRDRYVSLDCLLTFKKLASLTTEKDVVAAALKSSDILELHESGLSVRRVSPYNNSTDYTEHTVIIYPLDESVTESDIRSAIDKILPESKISAIWRKKKKHPETKLRMSVMEIHWNATTDATAFIDGSENGKKLEVKNANDIDEAITVMSKRGFDELFDKKSEKAQPGSKMPSISLDDIKQKVIDLVAESPIGPVKYVKNIVPEDIRAEIKYVHVIESDFNRSLVVFESAEACEKALKIYEGSRTGKTTCSDDTSTENTSPVSASIVDDEEILNTVLIGYKERLKASLSGFKNFHGRKRKGKPAGGKGKWRRT